MPNTMPYVIVACDYGIGGLGQYERYLLNGIVRITLPNISVSDRGIE